MLDAHSPVCALEHRVGPVYEVATLMQCGLIYLLGLTGLGQLIFPPQTDGSREFGPDGTIVESRLISQS